MSIQLQEYTTSHGEIILYNGTPNFEKLEIEANGYGDIWHSSFEQGYKNAFPEIVYQTITFYITDFDDLDRCVSWRINPNQFAVRKSVWNALNGFDKVLTDKQIQAFDFGYRAMHIGAIPLYSKGLFDSREKESVVISPKDRYAFFIKKFKIDHALFMLFRMGFWRIREWNALFYAIKKVKSKEDLPVLEPRKLDPIKGDPTVSYIIPTMMRQEYTLQLLCDLSNQTHKPSQVIIVDATPKKDRNESLYSNLEYPFEVVVRWQETKGSCKARNEAIELCSGDYIVFGDDDIRVPIDFIENHIRFIQTYNIDACNGFDVRADNENQTLDDLQFKLSNWGKYRYLTGVAQIFNNANNCVKREFVTQLIGNDINYDGGYGEDNDFGLSLIKIGCAVMQNPFSANLHLKPAVGGYRFWGKQATILGKKRKTQPWELDTPVKWIRPVPSPTVVYFNLKHYRPQVLSEYRSKYFMYYLMKGSMWAFPLRVLQLPYRQLQFSKAVFYARKLIKLGKRTK